MHERVCHFCGLTADYDSFPDGSAVYLGICACGECLENGKANDFAELVEMEFIHEASFIDELETV